MPADSSVWRKRAKTYCVPYVAVAAVSGVASTYCRGFSVLEKLGPTVTDTFAAGRYSTFT